MWQAPNQRGRGSRSKRSNSRPIHIKRVMAEIKIIESKAVAPKITSARVILNDMTAKGMGFFSSAPIMVGQEVAITLEDPKLIYLRGRITWCQEYDVDSHILSANSFSYRMGVQFVFESAEEEAAVKKFWEELQKQHLYAAA